MVWRYVGQGSYLTGVPARDLTDDEYTELNKAFREREGVNIDDAPEQLYKHEPDAESPGRKRKG